MAHDVWIDDALLFWPNSAATIPSGWDRYTILDARFLVGTSSFGSQTTGGSTTHTHTTNAHTHTQGSHVHTLSVTGASNGRFSAQILGSLAAADAAHTHVSSSSQPATATNQNTTVVTDASAELPPYFKMILIKRFGITNMPKFSVVFTDDHNQDFSNFLVCDGNDGAPDLVNRYVLGATASGDGGATGGAATHTHTEAGHTHTQNSHTHADSNFGNSSAVQNGTANALGTSAVRSGHHQATNIQTVTATNQNATATFSTESSDFSYMKLFPIQAAGAGFEVDFPETCIVPYVGTDLSVLTAAGWYYCDGQNGTPDLRSRYVKGTILQKEIGETGGSNTHLHTSIAHTHTQNSHTHTFTESRTGIITIANTGVFVATSAHTHTSFDLASATAANQNTTITMSASDGRYSWGEVNWVKKPKNDLTVLLKGAKILGNVLIK